MKYYFNHNYENEETMVTENMEEALNLAEIIVNLEVGSQYDVVITALRGEDEVAFWSGSAAELLERYSASPLSGSDSEDLPPPLW